MKSEIFHSASAGIRTGNVSYSPRCHLNVSEVSMLGSAPNVSARCRSLTPSWPQSWGIHERFHADYAHVYYTFSILEILRILFKQVDHSETIGSAGHIGGQCLAIIYSTSLFNVSWVQYLRYGQRFTQIKKTCGTITSQSNLNGQNRSFCTLILFISCVSW